MTSTKTKEIGLGFKWLAEDLAPSDLIACKNGKLRALTPTGYYQVETAHTLTLPDFLLRVQEVKKVLAWLNPESPEFGVAIKGGWITFGTPTSTLKLPQAADLGHFKDVDEILLKPLMTHEHKFTVDTDSVRNFVRRLDILDDVQSALVTVNEVAGTSLEFCVDENYIHLTQMVRYEGSLASNWTGTYRANALIKAIKFAGFPVSSSTNFSCTNNNGAHLSPLVISESQETISALAPVYV